MAFSLASPSSMLKLPIEEEAMYLSVFYFCICSCLCRGVNEFELGLGFVWPEAKESHFFFLLYWLTNESSTGYNATEIET